MTKPLQIHVSDGLVPAKCDSDIRKYLDIRAFSRVMNICESAIKQIDKYKQDHPILYWFSSEKYDQQRAELELILHQSAARESVELFMDGLNHISDLESAGMFNDAKEHSIELWERVDVILQSDDIDEQTESNLNAIKETLEVLLKNDNRDKHERFMRSLNNLLGKRSKLIK